MVVILNPLAFNSAPAVPWVIQWTTNDPDPHMVRCATFGLPYRVDQPIDAPRREFNHFDKGNVTWALKKQWGITSADDAERWTEAMLTHGMHAPIFDAFLPFTTSGGDAIAYERFLADYYQRNHLDPTELIPLFRHWVKLLHEPTFKSVAPFELPSTTLAWDIMRVEVTAGYALSIGMIPEQQYLSYAASAVEILQSHFASWYQVALSFWWGRAMWLADEPYELENFVEYNDIFGTALTHPDSPWLRVPLHT